MFLFESDQFFGETIPGSAAGVLRKLGYRVTKEVAEATPILTLLETLGIQVFVPSNWVGITMNPINLEMREGAPVHIKPAMRPIPRAVATEAKKEIDRMLGYFYRESFSPMTSPLVVAPKATPPYVRLCGDYRIINKWIKSFNFPIPDVRRHLEKAAGFRIFHDLDLTNAFHGIPITEQTSALLSVQTPWGQFEPKFLPEGVAPASAVLMYVMTGIFADMMEFLIVIFDNILVLATDYDDSYEKLEKVLTRCKEKNVFLKLSKSRFGLKEVEFFGYLVNEHGYQLTEARKSVVTGIPMPTCQKEMQRFLGSAIYFKPFIANYSDKTAVLNEMVHKEFDWDKKTWLMDYEGEFKRFKEDILQAQAVFFPDYKLPWTLFVDASDRAVGGVLVQYREDETPEVVAFVSKKFSGPAVRWTTIEKECFAIFYAVKQLESFLFMKEFQIATDHNNLLWMEKSEVLKIVRMRVYLQSFNFTLRHVRGSQNVIADWLSRPPKSVALSESLLLASELVLVTGEEEGDGVSEQNQTGDEDRITLEEALKTVHNSRMGHVGARRTWRRLNKYFPGHQIAIKIVEDFVLECPTCQKMRLKLGDSLTPPTRHLNEEHSRHMVGVDILYVTPPASNGDQYLIVIRMLPSRLVSLYPTNSMRAEVVAMAFFQYFIPDKYEVRYVVQAKYTQWAKRGSNKSIEVRCDLFRKTYIWNALDVAMFGLTTAMRAGMILVDEEFLKAHPDV
jgi:hypothetical protein